MFERVDRDTRCIGVVLPRLVGQVGVDLLFVSRSDALVADSLLHGAEGTPSVARVL